MLELMCNMKAHLPFTSFSRDFDPLIYRIIQKYHCVQAKHFPAHAYVQLEHNFDNFYCTFTFVEVEFSLLSQCSTYALFKFGD